MAKKVCFYLASMAKGGAQRVVANLTEYLLQQGYEVTIVTTHQEAVEYALPKGTGRVISDITENEVTGSRLVNFLRRCKKLRSIWKAENPDVLIAMIGKNNMMAILTTFFMRVKVLVSVRANPTMEYYNKLLRLVSKTLFVCADGVILQTPQQKEFFPRAIQKKAIILPNPLNPDFLRELDRTQKCKQIISVGRVDENKNHAMLVQVFDEIAQQFPDWKLILCGDGEAKATLDEVIRSAKAKDRIEAPGTVSDVAERMERSRIFVLTSREEGMPNALIEAMSMGLAVISTDCPCGGPAMLIEQGENGMLFPVDDAAACKAALLRILEDEAFEKKIGRQALRVREELSMNHVGEQWVAYIEAL